MGSRRGPTFFGKTSPSLRRMRKMTTSALRDHLGRLRGQIEAKKKALFRVDRGPLPPDDNRRTRIVAEVERLHALAEEGNRLMVKWHWGMNSE